MSVEREQVTQGAILRIIGTRHDRPVGTIARVTDTGVVFIGNQWWFTVEWLTYLPKLSTRRLRIWEEDLPTFELVTGPVVIPLPTTRRKQQQGRRPLSLQASLPFTMADDDE